MSGSIGDNVFRASGVIAAAAAGRTGTVDWDTTPKTGTVTAVSANGYFVNTTSGAITVNLPAASAGDIVAVADYASTAATNNITVEPNGSEKINGVNDGYTISTAGLAVTLVYVDSTRGWKSVTGSDADATGTVPAYVTATGGSPCAGATSGDYKIHSFTGDAALCVSSAGNACGSNTIDYLAIAGGGGGGSCYAGGGGAGGYRESVPSPAAWTGSPIANPGNARPVTATPYSIVVGAAGAAGCGPQTAGGDGGVSTFSDITSAGGGGGATEHPTVPGSVGRDGGSGGGGGYGPGAVGGSGNTPTTSPAQGFDGGTGTTGGPGYAGGGGGGAGAVGADAVAPGGSGVGGTGVTSCISATPTARGGGGGGAGGGGPTQPFTPAAGGAGGGGAGAPPSPGAGVAGTVNTGGGGGGGNRHTVLGGAGGSGLVIIRYKFQN
jgi:hypothetical protein